MATRWEITKAVRMSDLPAPARLVMFVLCDVAVVGTAEIPEKFTPSVKVLATETGLSRSTVQRHLSALEADGWITRTRPETPQQMWAGDRVKYRLSIPDGCGVPVIPGVVSETATQVSERDEGSYHSDTGVVSERPGGGITVTPLETDLTYPLTTTDLSSSENDERDDVTRICAHLADRIESNGSLRPKITKGWRTDARLLLDKDGRTVDQVIKAIDWCQDNEFWRSNIRSMSKLREQYDTLRLQASRVNGRHQSTTDARVAANAQVIAAFEAKEIGA
mgnify:CR=1 FL=1